jgi:acetyl esterase/lipase
VLEKAKSLPDFGRNNIVLYGGSGGAMLAIGTASKIDVACVVAGEPASVLLLAELDESRKRPDYNAIMADPQRFYTGKFKSRARSMFKEINSPILILHGDQHPLKIINSEIIVPELKAFGKDVTYSVFPGLNHGFYWGNAKSGATIETVEKIMRDIPDFIEKYTTLKPAK